MKALLLAALAACGSSSAVMHDAPGDPGPIDSAIGTDVANPMPSGRWVLG